MFVYKYIPDPKAHSLSFWEYFWKKIVSSPLERPPVDPGGKSSSALYCDESTPRQVSVSSLGPLTQLYRMGPLEYLLPLGRAETGGEWEGEWWFLQDMISSFPRGAVPWRQFQLSAWSKEALFGLRFPGSAKRDPHFAGNSVSVLSNTILNRLLSKITIIIALKKEAVSGFQQAGIPGGNSLMEPTDRCCMQSVKGFLRPGFQVVFIGQVIFKRVILAITGSIAGQEHEYPLKKPASPCAPLPSS